MTKRKATRRKFRATFHDELSDLLHHQLAAAKTAEDFADIQTEMAQGLAIAVAYGCDGDRKTAARILKGITPYLLKFSDDIITVVERRMGKTS